MSIDDDRASVEAHVQWLLRLLDLKKVRKAQAIDRSTGRERLGAYRMPLEHFTDALPASSAAALNWRSDDGEPDDDVLTIATPADVEHRLNVAVVQRCDEPGASHHGRMLVRRVRLVRRPALPVVRSARHIIEVATLTVIDERNGLAETSVEYFGNDGASGTRFTNLLTGAAADSGSTALLRVSFGLQFMRRYDWHVRIKGPKGTGLLIPATAAGCRKLLKERDLADGEVRRAALVHLVSEHQRRVPSAPRDSVDPADLTWVREHSRGRRQFTWNGMRGEVLPAQDVIDRISARA
ncbi:hypothetical protein [Streptomyces sp. NPDC002067]